jgi:hypothetical protein
MHMPWRYRWHYGARSAVTYPFRSWVQDPRLREYSGMTPEPLRG